MASREDILSFLRTNKEDLFAEFQIVRIGLFGSYASNEETVDSDIDLIVEFQPNTSNLLEKKAKIKNWFPNNSTERLIYAGKNTSSHISNHKSWNLQYMSEKDKANLTAPQGLSPATLNSIG